jgi:hypothetical protein
VDRLAIYGLPFLGLLLLFSSWSVSALLLFITLLFFESLLPQFSLLHGVFGGRYLFLSTVLISSLISIWYWRTSLSVKRPSQKIHTGGE